MRFNEFPFLRYTAFFILGVLIYPSIGSDLRPYVFLWVLLAGTALYLALAFLYRPKFRRRYLQLLPFLAYTNLVVLGMYTASLRDVSQDPTHLLHVSGIQAYLAVFRETDQQKPNSVANLADVYAVRTADGWQEARGRVQVYHRSSTPLLPGSVLMIQGSPERIAPAKNPEAFDYATFMARKQIYFSHFIGANFQLLQTGSLASWYTGILRLRQHLEQQVERYIRDDASAQIAKALLLGQKKDLDEEIGAAYATAGAMHVLAVSGLHVGMVYGFIFLFFKPHRAARYQRVVLLSAVVLLIWLYAALTGLSPSVLRAAAMFTFISLAQMKSRNPSIFNPLALSAMLLLLYDPFLVYAVGFQLSYTALLGILLFQPIIRSLWNPGARWLSYLWDISSVGMAAQLATFPLSIYYFHAFPTYFFLSNLVAIPGAFLIMALGLPFLLLSSLPAIAEFLGEWVNRATWLVNEGIFSFQRLPFAKIDFLHFNLPQIFLIWMGLFFSYLLITRRKKSHVYLVLLVLFLLGGYRIGQTWKKINQHYLLVYRVGQGLAVDYTFRGQLYSTIVGVDESDFTYQVLPHRIKQTGTRAGNLLTLDRGKLIRLELPDGKKLDLEKRTFRPVDSEHIRLYFWQAGAWHLQKAPYSGLLPPQGAMKITFPDSPDMFR
jgi:competence protein ComEC